MKAQLKDIHEKLYAVYQHTRQRAHESGTTIIRDMIDPIIDDLENVILADPAMIFPYDQTYDAIEAATKIIGMRDPDTKVKIAIDVMTFRKEFLKDTCYGDHNTKSPKKEWEPDSKTITLLATALFKRFPDLAKAIAAEAEKDPLTDFLNVLNKLG